MKNYGFLTAMAMIIFSALTPDAFANNSYKLIYECKILGNSTLARNLSIFGDFSSGNAENAPGLVILGDGYSAKALVGNISLLDNQIANRKATIIVPGETMGNSTRDLAISIDLNEKSKVSLTKKANGKIGLVISGTLDADKLENLLCEAR